MHENQNISPQSSAASKMKTKRFKLFLLNIECNSASGIICQKHRIIEVFWLKKKTLRVLSPNII